MDSTSRLKWLRGVLLLKVAACVLVWGLPALFGPVWLLGWFNIRMPEDPIYLRLFGALVLCLGLLYWFAYRNPQRNRDIITYAVVDNSLATLALLGVALTSGVASWLFWASGALTAFFAVAFWYLRPVAQPS